MARRSQEFQTIRSEGGLLPPDLLRRVIDPKAKLEGTDPKDYGLPPGERLNVAVTQSWNRLRKHWTDFRANAKNLPADEAGTGLTNDKWSVPLLRELGFGMLPTSAAPELGGKTYAINRFFGATPIHLIGCGLSLDRRAAGVRGAAVANPNGLVQDFLNRSDAHLWAILSNGLRLRILRDSQAISRQSYLEFDLEAMFDGEVFSDFVLLWLMAHATRFAAREGERPETCWLEQWTKIAEEQGTRALGDLKQGVEKALEILGQGFVGHPKNTSLRDALRTGSLPLPDFHGQLLRIVYRLIFLFVAEDRTLDGRPLLHAPDDSETARIARERYAEHYSAGRLREMAGAIRGSRHGDLWWQLNLVVGALSGEERFKAVREQLALPVLGSFLWSPDSTGALNAPSQAQAGGTELANADLLEAIRKFAFTRQNHSLRPVDYKNLGAEELGGVYESLLALTPQVSGDGAKFTFAEFAGNERKTSGSYYTPDSLVQCLLDSALDPVVEEAIKGKSGAAAEQAILALKVCDPAVGSGHFLVGAAHRLARHLARIRATAQGEGEPSPGFYQHALRVVIGRCLYGVDINPMAAELCRVSLWLEALDPGKPLSFLDHHIRVGNSLLGTTPELIAGGLPDDVFNAIEGDDKKVCAQLKKRNKAEREGFEQRDLLGGLEHGVAADLTAVTKEAARLDSTPDDTVDAVRRKADQFSRLVVSPEYKHAQQVADAWCATFVWPKTPATLNDVVTSGVVKRLGTDPKALTATQAKEVEKLSTQYQFFHWHLAFPEVFSKGGFDCVLGNPPWDKIQPEEQKFFAGRGDDIANADSGAVRKRLIADLERKDPQLHADWLDYKRQIDGECHLLKTSGRLRLTVEGNLNSYRLFAEHAHQLVRVSGRAGLIVQSGIATDESGKEFFWSLLSGGALLQFLDFNNNEGLFPDIDSRIQFALLTLSGKADAAVPSAIFGWQLRNTEELTNAIRLVKLESRDILLFNPSSKTCLMFVDLSDLALSRHLYQDKKHLYVDSVTRWKAVDFLGELFNMTRDSSLFELSQGSARLALYEAKYIHQFDHRFAGLGPNDQSVDELSDEAKRSADMCVRPKSFIDRATVTERLARRDVRASWLFGFRDIARGTNERTVIGAVMPMAAIGNNINLILGLHANDAACLNANINAFVFDYCARKKISGSHVNIWIMKQLPVIPEGYWDSPFDGLGEESFARWVVPRVLELTFTAWDLEAFAKDCGFGGPPFRWDEDRRFLLRAELDAAFFHLYLPSDASGDWVLARTSDGCPHDETLEQLAELKESFPRPRDAVSYIMGTFPIVMRKDVEKYGSYRTKDTILAIYDEMQEAIRTGTEYQTKLDPPPGDPRCCHPGRSESVS